MSDGGTARELGRHFLRLAEQDNISQFAGRGFAQYLLVGAILGCGGSSVRGALLRPEIKRHGRQRIIEGDLDPTRPVCVVDDILNSGQSACEAVHVLRKAGFQQLSYQCIFRFAWGDGRTRLERAGVASRWLATVNRDLQGRAPSSSRTTGDSFFQRWRISAPVMFGLR